MGYCQVAAACSGGNCPVARGHHGAAMTEAWGLRSAVPLAGKGAQLCPPAPAHQELRPQREESGAQSVVRVPQERVAKQTIP